MNGFEDLFAFAVEVARLRDGLTGTVEELRTTSDVFALERVLCDLAKRDMMSKFPRRDVGIEEYNQAWAEAYLRQVEIGMGPDTISVWSGATKGR